MVYSLFVLFINDVGNVFDVPRKLNADDLKMSLEIKNMNDGIGLSNNLAALHSWCRHSDLDIKMLAYVVQ